MTFWIVVGVVVLVVGVLAWWTSGWSRRAPVDARRDLLRSDAYRQSMENHQRFDPGGPGF